MERFIQTHFQLEVYKKAFAASGALFEASKTFPREEIYSLTDQMRKASRSVCANLAEAWRKRCYEGSFVAKLVDAEGEAAETQTWIQYAVECGYLDRTAAERHFMAYHEVISMLVAMRLHADKWIVPARPAPSPDKPI